MEAGQVALPEGFVIDQGDERLSLQDDLARAADRATAAKRNPAKDPEVRALQAKLEGMPLFGKAPDLPDGFVVDTAKPEAKDEGNPILDTINLANKAAGYLNPANLLTDEEKQQVLHDNPVATAYRFLASKMKVAEAVNALRAPDEDGVTPIEREIQRRKDAGESVAPRDIEQWVDQQAKKNVFGETPPSPPVTEQLKQMYQQAVNDPAKFARSFIVGSIAHPEYLMLGPVGGIAAIAGENVMEQKAEHSEVDANKLMTDVVTAGVPVLGFHAAVRLANLRAAKTTGAEPTAKVEEQALAAINAKAKEGISEGQEPQAAATAALDDVLAVMKIAPEERAAIVKGVEDAVAEKAEPESAKQLASFGPAELIPEMPPARNVRFVDDEHGITPQEERANAELQRLQSEPEALPPSQGAVVKTTSLDSAVAQFHAADAAAEKGFLLSGGRDLEGKAAGWPQVRDSIMGDHGRAFNENHPREWLARAEKLKAAARELQANADRMAAARTGRAMASDTAAEAAVVNLADIKSEIGWAETGGSIIRDPLTGEVAGRTQWIPKSEFWGERPGPTKISEKDAHAAIDKADAGEKLTPKEQRFVDYAKSELEKRNRDAFDAGREAMEERLGIQQYGRADPKLLAMLALPGVGAAAGYWLGNNQSQKIRDALIGGGIGAASLLLGKVRGAALRVVDAISDKRYNPEAMFREHASDIGLGRLFGYQFAEGLKALVKDPKRREAMTFALESGDRGNLSAVEQEALGQYEKWMRGVRDGAVHSGVDMGRVIDNYATHAYLRGMNTKEGLVDNLLNIMKEQGGTGGMSPKSRWAKQRVIPSYQEAIARGLIPVTTDIAEIARMYTDSVTRTVANKHFLDALARTKTPAGEPLLARAADLEKEIKRRQNEVLGRDPEMRPSEKLDADIAAIKAPSDYLFVNHPQLRDFRVHRDLAPPLRALMDATDPLAIEKTLHGVAVAAKSIIFSGSLFHAKSLVDAGMGAGPAAFKRGALKEIRDPNNEFVKEAVASGLNIIDRPMEAEIAPMRNALRLIEEKTPFPVSTSVKGLRWTQDRMNHFLWGVVHPTLKYNVWKSVYERSLTSPTIANRIGRKLGMAPNWDGMNRADVARMATSFTNDVFGGINWFEIANSVNSHYLRDLSLAFASPRGRRLMQIMMLAPDWTVATARSMYKAFPGMSEPQVAALHRQYLLRQSIIYLTAYNAINYALSGHHIWENKDPTMIDAGDGRRIQMAKHTMEPIHWLTQPGQQLWNKLGYPIKEPILQVASKDWITLKGGEIGGPPMGNRLAHALKSTLPIPTTTAADKGIVPAVTGFLGVPMYGRTEQQAIDDAIERALNLRQKRLDSDDPAEQAKARKKSQSETAAAAKSRVNRQYEKQREQQRAREQ